MKKLMGNCKAECARSISLSFQPASCAADFTRAIPLVVSVTLVVSYAYALVVTTALGRWMLRPRRDARRSRADRIGRALGQFAVRRPFAVLVLVLAVVGLEGITAGRVQKSFFPNSDREQLVVTVELAEGTHLEETDRVARGMARLAA